MDFWVANHDWLESHKDASQHKPVWSFVRLRNHSHSPPSLAINIKHMSHLRIYIIIYILCAYLYIHIVLYIRVI